VTEEQVSEFGLRLSDNRRTILILGATGMLGHMLARVLSPLHSVVGTISTPYDQTKKIDQLLPRDRCIDLLDITDWPRVEVILRKWRPDFVLNCVGLIKHKMNKRQTLDAILINSVFPRQLARSCTELGIRLIHFSTDCVFAGRPGVKGLTDVPDAVDIYGVTKRLGEVDYGSSLTLRTSFIGRQIVGNEELIEWAISQSGHVVNGFRRAIYSGLTTRALSDVVARVINQFPNLVGLYQVASSPISKFDLLSELNMRLRLGMTINPDDSFECDRTLDGSEFSKVTGIQVPSWDAMLSELCSDQAIYGEP
jgi:dTDP-4-dehydrorhamnose reductase